MKSDYKGNTVHEMDGKHVIHFTAIKSPDHDTHGIEAVGIAYREACNMAKDFHGKKFHNRSYGGGIAFRDLDDLKACVDAYTPEES